MNESTLPEWPAGLRCPYCNSPIAVDSTLPADAHCDECGKSFRVAGPSNPSTVEEVRTLDRFQLLERLGEGSFGVVWRARDTRLDRVVALKIPHPGLITDADLRERFHREARAAAQLRHPGIVGVHEVLDLAGRPVIVSDFISGVTLKELLASRSLTFREAATLVASVADALDYAHSRGLVHRDIKPANIMIEHPAPCRGDGNAAVRALERRTDTVGRPLLVDFGLARRDEAEVVVTLDGQIVGTPAYMSPEQAAGHGHRVDRRSDVYSLGVVLYQLLCGELPFRGSRAMLVHQLLNEEPRPPRRLNDKIPRDLETICLKAMAKEPHWRYATAGELSDDLQRYLKGQPILARPIGAARRLWLWCRRNAALASALASAAAALMCLLVLAVAFALRERQNAADLATALDNSNAHLREARFRLAESHLNRGLALCEQNNIAPGLLWLARSLQSAPPDADDLCRYLRLSLAAWQSRQCPLRACLPHPEGVHRVAFSPDGATCLTLDGEGTCQVWDVATGTRKALPFRVEPNFQSAALGTSLVVIGYPDGTVRRWKIPSGEPVDPPLKHSAAVLALALDREGSQILAGGSNGEALLWKMQAGKPRSTLLAHGGRVRCVALSPDGKWAFTGGVDKMARLWDVESGKCLHTLPHDAVVGCGTFSSDGKILATGCHDGTIRLWETARGTVRASRAGHLSFVNAVAISPDGRLLLTGSQDKSARLWSLPALEPIGSPLPHAAGVKTVAISPDASHVLTGSEDRSARLWALAAPGGMELHSPGQGWVRSIAFSPDGKILLTAGGELGKSGVARLWDARTGQPIGTPLAHPDLVWTAAFSPDNQTIAIGGCDGTVCLADARTGRGGPRLSHAKALYVVVFSPKGDLVLTGGEDGIAQLWETKTGKPFGKPLIHKGAVLTAEFHPSGDSFFTGSDDGHLQLWRTADQVPLFPSSRAHSLFVAAFSHDGKTIVVGSDKEALLYDATTGAFLEPPLTHGDKVRVIAFSPDDRLVLTAGDDGTAQLWNVESRTRRGITFPHRMPIHAAVFSPDQRLVLTASADGTARLWDIGTGRSVGPAIVHRDRVSQVAFSPDGRRLATGSADQTARLLDAPVPLQGEPDLIVRWLEIQTGMELDSNEALRILDAQTWEKRRRDIRMPVD